MRPRHMSTAGWLRQPYSGNVSARRICSASTRCLPRRGVSRTATDAAKSG